MDRYRYEEKCYYRHRYDTDPIIGGTLIRSVTFCDVQWAVPGDDKWVFRM